MTPISAASVVSVFGDVKDFESYFATVLLALRSFREFLFIPFSYLPYQPSDFLKDIFFLSVMLFGALYSSYDITSTKLEQNDLYIRLKRAGFNEFSIKENTFDYFVRNLIFAFALAVPFTYALYLQQVIDIIGFCVSILSLIVLTMINCMIVHTFGSLVECLYFTPKSIKRREEKIEDRDLKTTQDEQEYLDELKKFSKYQQSVLVSRLLIISIFVISFFIAFSQITLA